MNGLLIAVLIILVGFIIYGYWRGFIRIAFSLLSMVLTIVLVSWVTPHVTEFLKENTSIYEDLVEQCERSVRKSTQANVEQSMEEGLQSQETIEGLELPELWVEQILEKTGTTVNQFVEESGIYREVGEYIADWILRGVAFLASFVLVIILLKFLIGVLDIIAKLPVLKGVNKLFGAVAGTIQGLLVVWLLMFVIAIACTSQFGQTMIGYINESSILTFFYENNAIMYFLNFML